MANEKKKIALVTGANKGIGKEIARQLGQQEMTVLIGARDMQRGLEAAAELKKQGIDAHALLIDVADEQSVENAAVGVKSEYGGLDVLVNNAGVALDNQAAASATPLDILKRTYDTNVFGPFAVTKAFLPMLRESSAGRIVNMSSGLGSLTQNSDPNSPYAGIHPVAYNSSKAALNMITVIFANELKDTSIKVNAADPGYVATDLNNNSGPRTVEQGAAIAVKLSTLPEDGPTGGYFNDDGVIPW